MMNIFEAARLIKEAEMVKAAQANEAMNAALAVKVDRKSVV